MSLKNNHLNRWFWRWHIIAGLVTLPVMLLLSLTGIIYLFKANYNNAVYKDILYVSPTEAPTLPYEQQLAAVRAFTDRHVMQVYLPQSAEEATGFRLHSKGHSRDVVYVNPYSGDVTGAINQKQTLMYKVRKLHGELLLNKFGTLTVEWVASWFVVLILTGLYIWWPAKRFSLAGLFTIRSRAGRKTLWRDLHAVLGFWLSIFMLVILAGGMPWTDVFGGQLKWVQAQTDTGYPTHWRTAKGLTSEVNGESLSIDDMVTKARQQNLQGRINLKLPMDAEGLFRVANRSFWLSDQQVLYVDQYSGTVVKQYTWADVGLLMDLRQVAMRLHQGEYGLINWWIVLLVTLLFTLSTSAGLVSYLIRKPKGRWGLPVTPANFTVDRLLLAVILLLGVLFPLFGLSLVALWFYEIVTRKWLRVSDRLSP